MATNGKTNKNLKWDVKIDIWLFIANFMILSKENDVEI